MERPGRNHEGTKGREEQEENHIFRVLRLFSCPSWFEFVSPGRIVAKGLRMNGFVALLSLAAAALGSRQVIDETGLTGGYDIALTYTPEALSAAALAQRQGGAPALAAGVDPNGPNLFQALQDQLGLKLESRKIPLDIMVIDHVEPPVPE